MDVVVNNSTISLCNTAQDYLKMSVFRLSIPSLPGLPIIQQMTRQTTSTHLQDVLSV